MQTPSQLLQLFNVYLSNLKLDRKPQGLYEPVRYELSLGGKRIRPVLMLLAYQLYDENVEKIMNTALGIEMYHNYTLLHDDVMDRADMRRGKPTVHKVWNDNTAILSGDAMLVLAYQLMSKVRAEHLAGVLELFTETALEIGEGQQMDMEFEQRVDVSEDEYIEMIRLKTSVLLAAALEIGAIQANAPESDRRALYDFGQYMGLAFQLQDDLLDLYGDPATFGKQIGGDIICNKKTFMLINAMLKASDKQRAELDAWLTAQDFEPERKIAAVTEIYNQLGIRELAEAKIDYFFDLALAQLDALSVSEERKQALRDLAHSLMKRQS